MALNGNIDLYFKKFKQFTKIPFWDSVFVISEGVVYKGLFMFQERRYLYVSDWKHAKRFELDEYTIGQLDVIPARIVLVEKYVLRNLGEHVEGVIKENDLERKTFFE
jgi:hypothetical protein